MTNGPGKMKHVAEAFLDKDQDALSASERRVLEHAVQKKALSEDTAASYEENSTLGERMADRVAALGGSWTFLGAFAVFLGTWVIGNNLVQGAAFDPYPFIFLNLLLSMLAAIQAPIIMMSQNRQAAKDRLMSTHDYECNLKAEIEIMALHHKIDELRSDELRLLLLKQQEQIELLTGLLKNDLAPNAS